LRSLLKILFFLGFSGIGMGAVAVGGVWFTIWPTLPEVESLRQIELQTPLRIYTRDGRLMREFGEKRRVPLTVAEMPTLMKAAVIATEDRNFYRHAGVDPIGIARAMVFILREGRKGPGGSTITMQVARNFFLDRGKTYTRKLTEIMLAMKIERELGKDEVLELYLNKIFMGHRAYGVGAAAEVYYGKRLDDLSVAQIAMIAGLPQRPSEFNPISNPGQALRRRNHVLRRMREEGAITPNQYDVAKAESLSAKLHAPPVEVDAPYLAEMVRQEVKRRYGETAFNNGYRVFTTLDARLQQAADAALRKALVDYDTRHGWRGPELKMELTGPEEPADLDRALADIPRLGGLAPAIVTEVSDKSIGVYARDFGPITIEWSGLKWAKKHFNHNRLGKTPENAGAIVAVGDVVRVRPVTVTDKKTKLSREVWHLTQLPAVEGALVALDPIDGHVVALSGGFDFNRSKFNRVVQAERQPGSSFKPFIYSAALEKGFTAASTVNDAPVVFDDPGLESAWRPENYSGKFFGPTRLRWALTKSRNLVSIRLLQSVGIKYAMAHVARFGIDVKKLPRDLSLSLGSGAITPMELATGYSVLANGGFRVQPYFIERIESASGEVLEQAQPQRACVSCEAQWIASGGDPTASAPGTAPRTLPADNAWIMYSMMGDVITRGTARKALKLKRTDLAGKTGTTNDQRDAWFSGFNGALVASAWVGFDRAQPMGRRETGGTAALPMWIDFMAEALKDTPDSPVPQPPGLVKVRIDPDTGLLANAGDPGAIYEVFRPSLAPSRTGAGGSGIGAPAKVQREAAKVAEQLF
jgi:penicillin-binding protein 1A